MPLERNNPMRLSNSRARRTAFGALAVLGGCNTMEGAGRDIERGGQKIQNEANEHR